MGVEEVVGVDRLAPDLGVEVHAACREPAHPQYLVKGKRQLRHIHGKLVGVPTQEVIAAVEVERTEQAKGRCKGDLVLERMAGKNSVVLLNVDLHLSFQPELLEEAVNRGDVEI